MKKIKFSVISPSGDTKHNLPINQAIKAIQNLVNNEGKWLYINEQYVTEKDINEENLIGADDIQLTNALGGGNLKYNDNSKPYSS